MAIFLVTGGAGFIGSHLCEALIGQGHRVRVLDNFSTGKWSNLPSAVEVISGDAANPIIVRHALQGVDGVFHLAAIASVQKSNEAWYATHRTNIAATVAVFEAVLHEKQRTERTDPIPVVYASSAAVYGSGDTRALKETDPTKPLTAYGVDKLSCEHHAFVAGSIHHIPTAGFRFFNVYGPRQDPKSPYSGVISIFVEKLANGDEATVFGSGDQVRDFVHVKDIVRFLMAGMTTASVDAPVYNACTGAETSLKQLIAAIGAAGTPKPKIRSAAPRPGDIAFSLGDPRKAKAQLKVVAEVPLAEGIAELVALSSPVQSAAAA